MEMIPPLYVIESLVGLTMKMENVILLWKKEERHGSCNAENQSGYPERGFQTGILTIW